MTISMILLWIAVVFEFLLILGLVKRSEDAKTDIKILREAILILTKDTTPAFKDAGEFLEAFNAIFKPTEKGEGKNE